MATVYGERDIPGNIKTEDEAIEYAVGVAKEYKSMVWLVLFKEEKVYITEDGEIGGKFKTKYGDGDYPYVRIK